MNKNKPPLLPEALKQSIPNSGINRKWKIYMAFSLGVSVVVITLFLGVVLAVLVGFEPGEMLICVCVCLVGMGVCFAIAQYCLSRGNPQAFRQDWPLITAMNFAPFCLVIIALAFVNKRLGLVMLVVTIITLVCSYAGAGLATLTARRRSH